MTADDILKSLKEEIMEACTDWSEVPEWVAPPKETVVTIVTTSFEKGIQEGRRQGLEEAAKWIENGGSGWINRDIR